MNSGASEASGASHCTSRNRSIPSSVPAGDQVVRERFGTGEDHRGGEDEQPDDQGAPGTFRQGADGRGRLDQVRFGDVGAGDFPEVEPEEPEQREPQQQRDLPRRGDHERDDRGDRQEPELDPVGRVQRQLADRLAGAPLRDRETDEHDQRPAETEQQAVRAGHVGRGVGDVLGVRPGGVSEVEVDGVLGQHGDDGEDRDRQPAGDVDLGGFGGPGEHERRGDHSHPEQQQPDDRARGRAGEAQGEGGHGQGYAEPDRA